MDYKIEEKGTFKVIGRTKRMTTCSFMGRCITEYLPAAGYEISGVDAEYYSKSKEEAWFLVK